MRILPYIMTTYTNKYGLQPPTLNADLVRDQIRRGHLYQNKLIEIECWRRGEIRSIESQAGSVPTMESALQQADEQVVAIEKTIKSGNAKARTRVDTPEMKKELVAAKKLRKQAKDALLQARKEIRDNTDIKVRKEAIYEEEKSKQKTLRADKSIAPWYGTYMLIEDAFDRTRKMPMYDGAEPNDPSFKRFTGEGRIGIQQFQPNAPMEKVVGTIPTHTTLQIVPMPPPLPKSDGSLPKIGKKDLRLLRMRIGTSEGKAIWAEFPMVYHRDLPPSSVIQMMQVSLTKSGPREIWTASITFNDRKETTASHNISLCVGFDLGWREDGIKDIDGEPAIRIAFGQGSDNQKWDVVLSDRIVSGLRKVKELESIRDKEFDAIKLTLSQWLKDTSDLPEWLTKECEHLDKWKSQARMVRLVRKWKDNRFSGDESIFGVNGSWDKATHIVVNGNGLSGWRYHDHHLWQWECDQRRKAIAYRNEEYKKLAATLADQYDALIFEDIDLSNLARGNAGSTNRQLTGPSEFRNACKNACRSRGKTYLEVSARNTSKECKLCHHLNETKGMLKYFCASCNVEHDRDDNAAENILQRGREQLKLSEHPSDAQSTATARNDEMDKQVA